MEEFVVFRFGNETAFYNRLRALGLSVRTGEDENGGEYRDEERLGVCSTPVLVDTDGFSYMAARLTTEEANKFPNNDHNPAFTIIWRSGENPDETYPEITVACEPYVIPLYDEEGNITGTETQYTRVRKFWRIV